MFGAAGAPVTALRPSFMSTAQFLLSMIAPAAPAAPQGSSAGPDAAADFQGLLAGLMGAVAANDGEASGTTPTPRPSRSVPATEAETEAETAAPITTPGFLAAPVPLTPPVPPASPDGGVSTADASIAGEAPVQPSAPEAPSPDAAAAQPGDDGRQVQPGGPAEKTAAQPQVQPLAQAGKAEAPSDGKAPPPVPAVAGAELAARAVAEVAAEITRPEAPRPSPLALPAEPAPLRPLAERVSRPLDAAGREAAAEAGARAAPSPNAPVASTAEPASAMPDAPAKPAEAPAAVLAGSPDTDAEQGPADAAPAPEAPVQAAHSPAARDTAPIISRAAIDATAQIAAQILKRLDGRSTRFEMSLTPDELGRVDVKLDIDSEGRLAARLAFDNPAAAADLKGRADELRRQLEQQGFHLAEDAFEFAERDSGSSAFDRGPDTGRDARQGPARFSAAARVNTQADAAAPPRWTTHSLSPSGVDLKV